ncbi:MAG: PorT family protein [Bacteroidales bacterium]|nr:PorT family protein [Bacteroidales bacterium]
MKRSFIFTVIITAALAMPQILPAQGRVYMYDSGRQSPRTGRYHQQTYRGGTYIGFRFGLNATEVSSQATYLETSSPRCGLYAGVMLGQQVTPSVPLFLESGLSYSEKGGKSDYGGDFSYNLNYLEVPFNFKYMIDIPGPGMSIQPFIGPYVAIGVGGYVKDFGAREAYHSFGSEDYQFKRFDAGLKIGCGFSIQNFYAEMNYNAGLANIGHDMFDETHNRGFTFTVGVNF